MRQELGEVTEAQEVFQDAFPLGIFELGEVSGSPTAKDEGCVHRLEGKSTQDDILNDGFGGLFPDVALTIQLNFHFGNLPMLLRTPNRKPLPLIRLAGQRYQAIPREAPMHDITPTEP